MNSKEIKTVLNDLMENNLFLCDYHDGKMCLKNENDDIAFSFKLQKGFTTIESLQIGVNKLKGVIDFAINKAS